MRQCFAGQPLLYTIRNRTVIVKRKPIAPSVQQTIDRNRNKGENQPSAVGGQVTDAEGEPLIGVGVKVKGSTVGTVTDIDGRYSLNIADEIGRASCRERVCQYV